MSTMQDASGRGAHALIIEDNMIVGRAIEEQLWSAGFRSVDHARTECRALELARQHFPDLVVVGEHIEQWAGLAAARELGNSGGAPVVMVSANVTLRPTHLPQDAMLQGKYRIDQLGPAFAAARDARHSPCN